MRDYHARPTYLSITMHLVLFESISNRASFQSLGHFLANLSHTVKYLRPEDNHIEQNPIIPGVRLCIMPFFSSFNYQTIDFVG